VNEYDLVTLERTGKTVPIGTPMGVLCWAITMLLTIPETWSSRMHVVAEMAKARVVTVSHYAIAVVLGVLAHIWSPGCKGVPELRSGFSASRQLWNLLANALDNENPVWQYLRPNGSRQVLGLSTDLETATDYGNTIVGRRILNLLLEESEKRFPNFPSGLARLGIEVFCGPRKIAVVGGTVIRQRSWLMGDYMTKIVLSLCGLYALRKSECAFGVVNGDDIVALDHKVSTLERVLIALRSLDLKISEDDTYISKTHIFYCEELGLIPQAPADCVHVQMRRRLGYVGYVDYPRVRLLIPVSPDTERFSTTQLGRTSLLGKEARWTTKLNPTLVDAYKVATMLQKVTTPFDKDTLCPFTPEQIGGDGSYFWDPDFVEKVIDGFHCRNSHEVRHRLSQLMEGKTNYAYVRSEYQNQIGYKYRQFIDVADVLKTQIEEKAIVPIRSPEERLLLTSIKSSGLEDPVQTFYRLEKSRWYQAILRGERPRPIDHKWEPMFGSREFEGKLDLGEFVRKWANPGFYFTWEPPYLVKRDEVKSMDYLNLGIPEQPSWRVARCLRDDERREIVSRIGTFMDPDALGRVLRQEIDIHAPAPPGRRIVESDTYLLYNLRSDVVEGKNDLREVVVISDDIKLAKKCQDTLKTMLEGYTPIIWVVSPTVYLTGMMESLEAPSHVARNYAVRGVVNYSRPYVDHGSVNASDVINFNDGVPTFDMDKIPKFVETRFERIFYGVYP